MQKLNSLLVSVHTRVMRLLRWKVTNSLFHFPNGSSGQLLTSIFMLISVRGMLSLISLLMNSEQKANYIELFVSFKFVFVLNDVVLCSYTLFPALNKHTHAHLHIKPVLNTIQPCTVGYLLGLSNTEHTAWASKWTKSPECQLHLLPWL